MLRVKSISSSLRVRVQTSSVTPLEGGVTPATFTAPLRSPDRRGWAMRDDMRTELPLAALMMAAQRQRPVAGLICHSDRGS